MALKDLFKDGFDEYVKEPIQAFLDYLRIKKGFQFAPGALSTVAGAGAAAFVVCSVSSCNPDKTLFEEVGINDCEVGDANFDVKFEHDNNDVVHVKNGYIKTSVDISIEGGVNCERGVDGKIIYRFSEIGNSNNIVGNASKEDTSFSDRQEGNSKTINASVLANLCGSASQVQLNVSILTQDKDNTFKNKVTDNQVINFKY